MKYFKIFLVVALLQFVISGATLFLVQGDGRCGFQPPVMTDQYGVANRFTECININQTLFKVEVTAALVISIAIIITGLFLKAKKETCLLIGVSLLIAGLLSQLILTRVYVYSTDYTLTQF